MFIPQSVRIIQAIRAMVAAPQLGTFTLVGASGQHYTKDVYISDVVGGLVRFSAGGLAGATTLDHWTPPEPVRLVDFSILVGLTDTEALQITRAGNPTGDVLRYANHLNTLNSRPIPNIPFGVGMEMGANQL